jgi:hypothetical protein
MNTENRDRILNHILKNQVGFVSGLPVIDEEVLERYRKLGMIKIGVASTGERTYKLVPHMKPQVRIAASQTKLEEAMDKILGLFE